MPQINLLPEIVKSKFEKPPNYLALLISIILVIGVLGGYCFLVKSRNALSQELVGLDEELARQTKLIQQEDIEEILDFQNRLDTLKSLFESHFYWSQIFKLIENSTVKNVFFKNFNGVFTQIDSKKKAPEKEEVEVKLTGEAASFNDLAKQIISFRELPKIKTVDFSSGALKKEGGVSFKIKLIFEKDALLKNDI